VDFGGRQVGPPGEEGMTKAVAVGLSSLILVESEEKVEEKERAEGGNILGRYSAQLGVCWVTRLRIHQKKKT
jgi:hypothetical protein